MASKGIRNAVLMGTNGTVSGNHPHFEDTARQYFARSTQQFYTEQMKWSSTRVKAKVQGLNSSDFYAYTERYIRVSDVQIATTGEKLNADWQYVMVEGTDLNYLPRGAKICFNGNTWLVVNPLNIQGVHATGIMCRCDAVWNWIDDSGELQHEPFHFGNGGNAMGSDNYYTHHSILMDSYIHSYMQRNERTKELRYNTRMIVGTQAYTVQGLVDGYQEFTEDAGSIRLMHFDCHLTEALDTDDLENRIAGGLANPRAVGTQMVDPIKVPDSSTWTGRRIVYVNEVPDYIPAFTTVDLYLGFYVDDVYTSRPITISTSGADADCYSCTYNDAEKKLTITALNECAVPLTITASGEGAQTVVKQIRLVWR